MIWRGMWKGFRSQLEEATNGQIWYNVSEKINNAHDV